MAATQSPLVGLQMDEPTAKYVGTLEGMLARYAIQEAGFRTVLELITHDSWEDVRVDVDGKMLQRIAVDSLVKQGIDRVTALGVVTKRWNARNMGPTPLPKAVPVEDLVPQQASSAPVAITKGEMKDRLADWRQRNEAAALAEAKKVPDTPK